MTEAEFISALLVQNSKLRKGIKRYLDGNYARARSPNHCRHGRPYYEACELCIDAHFRAILKDVGPIPAR